MVTLSIIILCCGIFLWFLLNWVSSSSTLELPTAYAGSPKPQVPTNITFELPKRRVTNFIGNEKIDLSKLRRVIIKGHSLEKLGVADNSIAYCSLWTEKGGSDFLNQLPGRFIVLNIDNERTAAEHPLKPDYFHSNGKKARKALRIVSCSMDNNAVSELADAILRDIDSDAEKIRLKEEIIEKYAFASSFYASKGETDLIMSLTYRNDGKDLGFSFHSPKYIYGIVEYIGNNNYLTQIA